MIELSRRGDIAVLTMVHGKANALDIELLEGLIAAVRNAARCAGTRRGADRAGADVLGRRRPAAAGRWRPDYVRRFLPALHRLYDTVFFFPKPVVAAVNGHAIAGGCVLECCADRRIAAKDGGRIGVTELLVGVPFPAMAFEVMRFATAPQYFADGILSGATYLPDIALQRGLIDEVVEPSALLDRAVAAAETLAALPPRAFEFTKRQIRQPVTDAMERHAPRIDKVAEEIWTSPATIEHIRGYVARTFKKG